MRVRLRIMPEWRKLFWSIIWHLFVYGGAGVIILPLVWMVSCSLKGMDEIFILPIRWIPNPVEWHNYKDAIFGDLDFIRYIANSCIYSLGFISGVVISNFLIAYAFARMRFPGRNVLFLIMLSTLMLPIWVTIIPRFMMFRAFGWLDSYLPLIVPAWFGGAYSAFLLIQFMKGVPTQLEDAARIEGCGTLGIIWHVILPLVKPALVAVAIFAFMFTWADFLQPLVYLSSTEKMTVSLALNAFSNEYYVPYNLVLAASTVTLIPPALAFFFSQKYFIQGIVITGVKG